MISKVEELRMDIISNSTLIHPHQLVDSLILAILNQTQNQCKEAITAAHAEGVAEGAEQEKDRIRKASEWHLGSRAIGLSLHVALNRNGVEALTDLYIVPASVLAPTKEKP